MNKFNVGVILWMLFESSFANPEQEAKTLAERLQQKPSIDQQKLLEELRQSSSKQAEEEIAGLQSLFEVEGDVGKKAEDPLKSSLGKKNLELSRRSPQNQPRLKEVEELLKQKNRFKISYQDPLFKAREEDVKLKLDNKGMPSTGALPAQASPQAKIVTCRQSAKPELKSCTKRLVLTPIPQPPITKMITTYATVQRWVPNRCGCPKCDDGRFVSERVPQLTQTTVPQPPLLKERWEGCEDLERRLQEGSCEKVESEEQHLNETRTIPEYPSPITRGHWSERHAFICGQTQEIDECLSLFEQGCEQIGSKCVSFKDDVCVEFENTFKCGRPDYLKNESLALDLSTHQFIKTQHDALPSFEARDFGEAITQFKVLNELGQMGEDGLGGMGGSSHPSVFNGKCQQCRVNLGSFFRDCCKLKGILQGLLGGCNEEEKKLAVAAIKKRRCVKVEGRYCHRKVLGVCVEKRDSYCCYGSQLARIIQEIAHQQLNIAWGSAESPNCSSLSAEQLSRINFDTPYAQSKLAELLPEAQASIAEKFDRVTKQIALGNIPERLKNLSLEKSSLGKGSREDTRFLPKLKYQLQSGQIEPFKALIDAELGGSVQVEDLQLLLHQASTTPVSHTKEFIDFLLSKGAEAALQDEAGHTPIDTAILSENLKALQVYQAKGLLTEAHKEKARQHNKTAVLESLR